MIKIAIQSKMKYDILRTLVNTASPSGAEGNLKEIFNGLRYRHFRLYQSANKSLYYILNRGSKHTIIFDAHIDQIHARIRTVREDGIIIARPIGFDAESFSGQRVIIHSATRDIEGIIQTQPPHLNQVTKTNNIKENKFMYIDTGLTQKELSSLVINGDSITFDAEYKEIGRNYITGPGLDNKASAFVLINLMHRLDKTPPNCNIIVNFSSREEVGSSTINYIMNHSKLSELFAGDVSLIVVDTHLGIQNTAVDEHEIEVNIDIGKGPTVENDATTSQEMLRTVQRIAKKRKIPIQFQYTDFGGTNKTNYDLVVNAKSIDIGVPLRNMHSAVETVDKRDLKWTEELLYAYIQESC